MTTKQQVPSPTLIFIPDISGFTEFVNTTEIQHSQHIINELLEEIIEGNEIGLEVSEIEGDAVLFFREGTAPTAAELLAQIQRMYTKFHSHLAKYQSQRICHCGACTGAHKLSLKFITHYGEIVKSELKNFRKLFGKDLIVAHRLMKNAVPHEEYALFTNQLLSACSSWINMNSVAWTGLETGEGAYDFGTVSYCYLRLDELKKHIPALSLDNYLVPNAQKGYLTTEKVISAPLETVFSVLTDLEFRAQWIPGLKDSDQLNSKIAQNGSAHRCLIAGDESDPYFQSHSYKVRTDVITFVESESRMKLNVFYTLKSIGQGLTRLERVDCFKNDIWNRFMYFLKRKKSYVGWINSALDNFKGYCEELTHEGKMHATQIVLPQE